MVTFIGFASRTERFQEICTIKDFKLQIALRQVEKGHKMPTKPNIAKAAIALSDQDEFVELKRMVKQLTTTFSELQGQNQKQFIGNNFRGRGN